MERKESKMNRYERIQQMNIEELASFLYGLQISTLNDMQHGAMPDLQKCTDWIKANETDGVIP